jgi:membrane-associated phospholipid phosphatase
VTDAAPRSSRAGLLVGASIALAFGLLAWLVFATPGASLFDQDVSRWAAGLRWPGGVRAVRGVSWLGTVAFLAPASLAVALALARRGRRAGAWLFLAWVVGAFLLETALKLAFRRVRPHFPDPLASETTYSFPSGHATMVTVFFGGLAGLVWRATTKPAPRVAAVLGAALAVGVVSLSRICLGVHWPTDVAAGALVGLFWIAAAMAVADRAPAPPVPGS